MKERSLLQSFIIFLEEVQIFTTFFVVAHNSFMFIMILQTM